MAQLNSESLVAQLVRAPNRCLGGHGFDSRRGLRVFLCPTLVSCWIISSLFITELEIYHLYYLQFSVLSKRLTPCISYILGMLKMASTLRGSGFYPSMVNRWPINETSRHLNLIVFAERNIAFSSSLQKLVSGLCRDLLSLQQRLNICHFADHVYLLLAVKFWLELFFQGERDSARRILLAMADNEGCYTKLAFLFV